MTWVALPQTDASVSWLREHFPNPGSSLEWIGARNLFRAWINVDSGSVLVVQGIGDFAEAGFISTSLRAPGSSSPLALSFIADNKYASAEEALNELRVGFELRLEEAASAARSALSPSGT